jgi:hypothetical protein
MKSSSVVQKFRIHGSQETLKGFLHLRNNPDGTLAEIELDIYRDGTMGRAMVHALTMCINMALKRGVPLREIVDEYRSWKFEPMGAVSGSPYVSHCDSILDYVAQELEATYLKETCCDHKGCEVSDHVL